MNILAFVFVLSGFACIYHSLLVPAYTQKGLTTVLRPRAFLEDFKRFCLFMTGVILSLLGLHTIPHEFQDYHLEKSLVLPEEIISLYNPEFNILTTDKFIVPAGKYRENSETTYTLGTVEVAMKKVAGVYIFTTKDKRNKTLEFFTPRTRTWIMDKNGRTLEAHRFDKTSWNTWPWKLTGFKYYLK